MAKKRVKAKVETLKPIRHNKALEREYSKRLRAFSRQVNNSVKYWALAQFHKAQRGEITNLATSLRIEFSKLKEQWESKAREFAQVSARKLQKGVSGYVDTTLALQSDSYKLKGLTKQSKAIVKASYLENLYLIKSIPSEIIMRYEGALYNTIAGYDSASLNKLAKTIGGISDRRARTIAIDQTNKAIEKFSIARSQDLGFEYYQWQTAEDERVSTGKGGHRQLNGRIYRYDTPTAVIDSYGNKGHTAQRVRCRCIQLPVIIKPNQKARLVRDSQSGDYYEIVEI